MASSTAWKWGIIYNADDLSLASPASPWSYGMRR